MSQQIKDKEEFMQVVESSRLRKPANTISSLVQSQSAPIVEDEKYKFEASRLALEKALWLASKTINTPSNLIF